MEITRPRGRSSKKYSTGAVFPVSCLLVFDLGTYLEVRLFEQLAEATVLVHRDDVVGPADGLAAQNHVRKGVAPSEACQHSFDKVPVICG